MAHKEGLATLYKRLQSKKRPRDHEGKDQEEVDIVLDAMKNHCEDIAETRKALSCVSWLAEREVDRAALIEGGACEALVATVKRHKDKPAIQEVAHSASISLTHGGKSANEAIRRLGEEGMCEHAVSELQRLVEEIKISYSGVMAVLGVVNNLAWRSKANAERLVAAGAAEALAKAMSGLAAKPELQERAMSSLDSLGRIGKTARTKLGLAGICPLVVAAMLKFPGRDQLHLRAAEAMHALKNEGNLVALRDAGAVAALEAALERFKGEQYAVEDALYRAWCDFNEE